MRRQVGQYHRQGREGRGQTSSGQAERQMMCPNKACPGKIPIWESEWLQGHKGKYIGVTFGQNPSIIKERILFQQFIKDDCRLYLWTDCESLPCGLFCSTVEVFGLWEMFWQRLKGTKRNYTFSSFILREQHAQIVLKHTYLH